MAQRTPWQIAGGVAVITGAGSGIGAALAASLARRGMHLALVDRDEKGLQATQQALQALPVKVTAHLLDVTDRAGVAALPQQVLAGHGKVTVLVNNAGVAVGGSFLRVDEADYDWLMEVNFGSVVRLTRGFLPLLQREPAAQVVNISSIFGIIAPPEQTAYCASKFAVRGFSESLRHELEMAGSSVGVTVVHPGGVRTSIGANAKPPKDVTPAEIEQRRKAWQTMLTMPPEQAGEIIAGAIERREPRVLVGDDARRAALVQRLFPVTYWKHMARSIQKRLARQG